jgi:hypothetical protein
MEECEYYICAEKSSDGHVGCHYNYEALLILLPALIFMALTCSFT